MSVADHRGWLGGVLLLITLLGAAGARAQVVLMDPSLGGEGRVVIGGRVEQQFDTAIDGGGNFERLRFHIGVDGRGAPSENIRLSLYSRYTNADYTFGTGSIPGCPSPAACWSPPPWKTVHTIDVAPGAALVLTPGLHIVAILPIRWSGETGADATGMTAGISTGVRFSIARRLYAMVGIGVQSELEDDVAVFPVVAVDWRIMRGLSFRTTGGPYQGGGGELVWGPSRNVQLALSSGYERDRFRVNGGDVNPSGVGEYRSVPVLAGFRLGITSSGYLQLEGGLALRGELRLYDARGDLLRASDFDTAGIVRGEFGVRF